MGCAVLGPPGPIDTPSSIACCKVLLLCRARAALAYLFLAALAYLFLAPKCNVHSHGQPPFHQLFAPSLDPGTYNETEKKCNATIMGLC